MKPSKESNLIEERFRNLKLYAISGLGADKQVFKYLNLDVELIPIDWIEPKESETIEAYALRLADKIDVDKPFGILGVSFGGLIAVELSKFLNPEITILISSAETKYGLRFSYRFVSKLNIIRYLPKKILNPPKYSAHWFFGAKNKILLNNILDKSDLSFNKWALIALVNWKNEDSVSNRLLKIHGTADKLIPSGKEKNQVLIEKGTHFMIVDRADEVSQVINQSMLH